MNTYSVSSSIPKPVSFPLHGADKTVPDHKTFVAWCKDQGKVLTEDQKNILFNSETYSSIDTELKLLIQQALINSVKSVVESSEVGKDLLTKQLNFIKSSKDKIVAQSNKEIELFKKFQIAAKANPELTYNEFIKTINDK